MPDVDLDDLPTIELIPDDAPAGLDPGSRAAARALSAVIGGAGLYYPKMREDGSVTLPKVQRGERQEHYFKRIFGGESEELPEGYQGPPRPLSVQEIFQRGHCGTINAQAALKYGRDQRRR